MHLPAVCFDLPRLFPEADPVVPAKEFGHMLSSIPETDSDAGGIRREKDSVDVVWPKPFAAWATTLLLALVAILSYTDRLVIGMLVAPLRQEFLISNAEVGILQGLVFAVVYSVAGIPLSRLADRSSRAAVIVGAVIVWSVATLYCAYAQNFTQLVIARMIVAVGEAALTPAAVSLIADSFPARRRGTAIAVYFVGMISGSGAAIFVGGVTLQAAENHVFATIPIIGHLAPWRQVLALLGAVGIPMAAILLTISEPRRQHSGAAHAPRKLADVLRNMGPKASILWFVTGATVLCGVVDYVMLSWVPTLLSRQFHWTSGAIGRAFGMAMMVAPAIGAISGGLLADRFGNVEVTRGRLMLAGGACCIGFLGTLLPTCASGNAVIASVALWSLMSAAAHAAGITAMQEIVPSSIRSWTIALGALGTAGLGMGIAVPVVGVLMDGPFSAQSSTGWSIATIASPAAVAAGLMFWKARSMFFNLASSR